MAHFLGLILALLPTYLIRFKIFGLPTTLLEILVAVFLFSVVVAEVFRLPNGGLKSSATFNRLKKLGLANYAVALFVISGIIATIVSPEPTRALGQLKAFIVEPVLLFYAILLNVNRERLIVALRWLFWSAALISIFGIVQYFTFIRLPLRFWGTGVEGLRITSFFEYPNALALYLAPLIGFFAVLWDQGFALSKNKSSTNLVLDKWVERGVMGIMGIALVLTSSRGAWFALILVLLLYFAKKYGLKKVLVPAIVLLILMFLVPSVSQRIRLGISDPSSIAHINLMKTGVEKIAQNPFLGNGLAGFVHLNLGVNYPHNIFLNFWLELGLMGLISFAWIIFLVWRQHKKTPSALTMAAGVYVGIMLIHGLVDVPFFKNDLAILFWFIVSLFSL